MQVHAGGVDRCPYQGAVGWFGLCPLRGTNQVRKLAPPAVRSSGMATQSLPDCCPVLASSLWGHRFEPPSGSPSGRRDLPVGRP